MPTLEQLQEDHYTIVAVLLYPVLNVIEWWQSSSTLPNLLERELTDPGYQADDDLDDLDYESIAPILSPRAKREALSIPFLTQFSCLFSEKSEKRPLDLPNSNDAPRTPRFQGQRPVEVL